MNRALILIVVGCLAPNGEPRTQNPEPGRVRVGFARPGGGYVVEAIPLEAYVGRVIAGEAARDSPPAALDALAITVRTFALANLGRHRDEGFDLCDQTHCQVVRPATLATQTLRARDDLARTLGVPAPVRVAVRVHPTTDSFERATGRPWVREGAAVYFAEPSDSVPPSVRTDCPADAELLRPVSIGALANAHARARACFAKQIAQGRSWKDVK